jgi:hypothetical protein
MRSTRPLLFTLICKTRILPLRARLRYRPSTAITSLHAQTRRKNELTNSSTETTKEGIEGLMGGILLVMYVFSSASHTRRIDQGSRRENAKNCFLKQHLLGASTYVVSC